jgi:hypothetical protein
VSGGRTQTATQRGDAGDGEGVQFSTGPLGDNEIIVIDSKAYMRADATMLENMFGYDIGEAAPYVDKWIAFSPTDSLYSTVAADVTTESIWGDSSSSPTDQLPQSPASVSGLSTSDGRTVQTVQYLLHGTNQTTKASFSGTEAITFLADQPHLPTALTEHLAGKSTQGASTVTDRVTFSQWGEHVNVQAPTTSIPFPDLPPPSSTI